CFWNICCRYWRRSAGADFSKRADFPNRLLAQPRRLHLLPEGGAGLGHGGAAILLALLQEALLMRAEAGDPRPDFGLEVTPQVWSRDLGGPLQAGNEVGVGEDGLDVRHRRGCGNGLE